MLNYISADWIFPVNSPAIQNGVIGLTEEGKIEKIFSALEAKDLANVTTYKGALVPGFINTHCHLELSHLKDKIEQQTGLPGFIKQILSLRQQPDDEVLSAMKIADQQMAQNGIVAVGDISNQLISKSVKQNSKIYYHTFVEVFGFNRPSAPIIAQGEKLKQEFLPLKASVVPHAPYSVSAELFGEINKITNAEDILSIHNQETESENELFEAGTGAFADFFSSLGIAQSDAHNTRKNSIAYHLPQMPKAVNTLLVHNTFVNKTDVDFATKTHQQLYWCLCPNANLYIEGTLPDVNMMTSKNVKITLGTDSLASNLALDILAEMKTLQERKLIEFEELLKWATLNGAEFLNITDNFGSFEVGKKPGVLLLSIADDKIIKRDTVVKRLF
ncbi:amidohydrolase family protein [Pedobacter namyangjuensis]|uniref:amidohydrolase family protein n=1 Tax=Pedobacter namyangjuensis TaxID=600626 RepID=UPI000DE31FA2|nr:amidohydrolase family protein [Pedobacter namyangjuensis]